MTEPLLPAVMTIADFGAWSRMGPTCIYEEIACGALKTFKIGRRAMIATKDAEDWLARYRSARPGGMIAEGLTLRRRGPFASGREWLQAWTVWDRAAGAPFGTRTK